MRTSVPAHSHTGRLDLPTGRVVACDPFVYLGTGDIEPFTVTVGPGRYRVEAAVATLTRPGEPPSDRPHRLLLRRRGRGGLPGDEEGGGPLWDAFENSHWPEGPHLVTSAATGRTLFVAPDPS
ncbi:DUF4241 domain-containing protein [Streptomyces ferrugineus]|uniref:DUF4241 domain-containing protein n=1 Tax=Streptomyces ferrugineus TaxID=1413221 RepID=UPI001D15A684|nr:DUF4241 domain-containing protein [Streptomyces ferrugineus]